VQKNVRLLSVDNVLPLNTYDDTRLLANELPSLYYQKNVSDEDREVFYSITSLPLVHGMGMDFYPSRIKENSIKEYKVILDNWKRDIPNSVRLYYEYGWYNLLTNNYDTAILFFNNYIKAMESGKIIKETPLTKGFALSLIAKCYDLEGNRVLATDYYTRSMSQLKTDKQEKLIDYLITPYLKEPYKK
jgi:tetratricopeptide (TPR) repeat protein